jgi:CreA protein
MPCPSGRSAVPANAGTHGGHMQTLRFLPKWIPAFERAKKSHGRAIRGIISMAAVLALSASAALADDIGCVSTTFRLVGRNDKVCVSAFDDPKVPGVACHISQARTGGLSGSLGLAEDPSRFSIACRQLGPITADIAKLVDREKVYTKHTSIFFKHTNVFRIVDKKRNTLVYLAISDKLAEGSPQNAISTVPIMPWSAAH